MKRSEKTDAEAAQASTYAGPGRFALGRIHLSEALVGVGGVAMVAGLLLPWADGDTAIEALSLIKLLVLVIGAAAVAVPLVVALSSKTDLPISWETLLSVAITLLTPVLFLRLLLPPEGGLDHGFFVVLAGTLLTVAAGWRSVAREY